jgi:protein-tyrosine phosphatase
MCMWFYLLYRLGTFRSLRHIDPQRVKRLVFVCKGNICRSPYAEARARTLQINAISSGMDTATGLAVDPSALQNAFRRDIDLSAHQTRPLSNISLGADDLVICMEPSQARALRHVTRSTGSQITLLGLWAKPPQPNLTDPHGRSDAYFQNCFALIDDAVGSLVDHLHEIRRNVRDTKD